MADAESSSLLVPLEQWFGSFCASFRSDDAEVQRNYDLKEIHTRKVCEAARVIAMGGSPRRLLLAEVTALCHDLGRFPQFHEYGTFKDSDSLNHACLSADILKKSSLLDFLSTSERDNVITAVRLHNVYQIPSGLAPEAEDLLKIVRDADKVDIWRVFIDFFHAPDSERASAVGLGFPDLPQISPEALAQVRAGKMVQLSVIKSLNDFKLLQLSWLYDINFQSTLRMIIDRRIIDQLAATLPQEESVLEVLSGLRSYVVRKVKEL